MLRGIRSVGGTIANHKKEARRRLWLRTTDEGRRTTTYWFINTLGFRLYALEFLFHFCFCFLLGASLFALCDGLYLKSIVA